MLSHLSLSFFFNDTATAEIYTLSLHDALPISPQLGNTQDVAARAYFLSQGLKTDTQGGDRKSTRLNSSHQIISYAVFCLKKKKIEGGGILRLITSLYSWHTQPSGAVVLSNIFR